MNLFKVEIYKIIKSKKYLLAIIAMLVLIIIQMFAIYNSAQNERPEIKIKNNEKLLVDYRVKVREEGLSQDLKKDYEAKIKKLEEENKELQEELVSPNYNWKEKLKKKNESLKKDKQNAEIALNYNEVENVNSQIKVNEHLINNNIMPQKPYKISAFANMKNIIGFINIIFLPILVLIICYDQISGEIHYSTIKMLLTKPITRGKILISKFLSSFIICCGTLILLEVLAFIILGIFFNVGNPLYPMNIGTKYRIDILDKVSAVVNSSFIIPTYRYLLDLLIIQVIFIFTEVAFGVFISTMYSNNVLSLMTSTISIFVLNIVTFILPQSSLSKIYPYLFTTYADGIGIIEGNLNLSLETTNLNPNLAVLILLIWSAIFLLISYLYFNRKDIVA
ncbi:ABC transporter permease [Clostridium omnivorum]|uniref:Lipoprotein n=1 Tax=Clostridium omnivorum TaxID=1604902 RepID=A0ABQ5N2K0_9CLOT|nr:ABC transporter permease [Clostridium sp. E14]GLC29420.1 lipoprotein [Clostridium sp. E14]